MKMISTKSKAQISHGFFMICQKIKLLQSICSQRSHTIAKICKISLGDLLPHRHHAHNNFKYIIV